MVHWQNVQHILNVGICCATHGQADPNYIDIGHRQLIIDRTEKEVPLSPGGNLGEYVPFYFSGHSPMLYMILYGRQGVQQRSQSDIVYLVVPFIRVVDAGVPYVFTDMNAKRSLASFYNHPDDLAQLDWESIEAKQWNNDEQHPGRKEYKQAEFLVHQYLPVHCISAIVVYNEERKQYFDVMVKALEVDIPVFVDETKRLYY